MSRSWSDLERHSIREAIELWHRIGAEEFISRTRYKESNRYVVVDRGQVISSKPLLAMAFQLQFGCDLDGPPRLSGGDQTRAILNKRGFELVDTYGETPEPAEVPIITIDVQPDTNFWWVNQSSNFDLVYADGTLWAAAKGRNGQQVAHWQNLENVRPGDLVIHYSRPEVRGVSRVATMPTSSYPPDGYGDIATDTPGRLVLTSPLHARRVPRETALQFLDNGVGPLTNEGGLRNGYLFPLNRDNALEILHLMDVCTAFGNCPPGDLDISLEAGQLGPTDNYAITRVRAEQRFLRRQQLRRWGGQCALCGQKLPDELLVAAHIKPRWACSDEERMDIVNISMLTCLFGCDALFELGYVVVSDKGTIEWGTKPSHLIRDRLTSVVGRSCQAHTRESREYFSWHRQHHLTNRES
ncbi:HNH endonuclease [Arthrobacter sp. NPDC055585]